MKVMQESVNFLNVVTNLEFKLVPTNEVEFELSAKVDGERRVFKICRPRNMKEFLEGMELGVSLMNNKYYKLNQNGMGKVLNKTLEHAGFTEGKRYV